MIFLFSKEFASKGLMKPNVEWKKFKKILVKFKII